MRQQYIVLVNSNRDSFDNGLAWPVGFCRLLEVVDDTDLTTLKMVRLLNSLCTVLLIEVSVCEKVSDEEQCASCCPLNAWLARVGTADRDE